ncbi:MAG: type II secretion system ATPase GspE [Gammaproteobacteria bacterium]|nr:type II secretion system ATPase GspE [Gammaproteobacteria bacterium]
MAHLAQNTRLPYAFAKRHGVLIKSSNAVGAVVAIREQTSSQSILEIQRFLTSSFSLEEITATEFDRLLQKTYEQNSGETQLVAETLGDNLDLKEIAQHLPEPEDLLESADEAPIIRLINALLAEAVKEEASDIHIEPYEDHLAVRLRIDGVLREVLQPQRALGPMLTSRIKVMAKLDIAEKRLPQDGRISLRIGGRAVDVRVSTLPSSHGERVVLRLLDKQAGRLDLSHLGMQPPELKAISQLIHQPHGVILVTGPTGSGKTTSLYAALTQLNEQSRNILTVEDPIEYYINGIGQTQVNTRVDMSFARGLRAILRQDPDVIMVGEIRDMETAEIAVQASLTGHLVLSTLHTNTATGAITRLRDMGIEPFLIASSLIGAVAQRLVRRLCDQCKSPYTATPEEMELMGAPVDEPRPTLYRANGCTTCNHLGFKGRMGIFEVVTMDDTLRRLIHSSAGEYEIEQHAREQSAGLMQNAVNNVMAGETSLDEVVRVNRE